VTLAAIVDGKRVDTIIPPSGHIARVQTLAKQPPSMVAGVPIPVEQPDIFGEVTGLPPSDGESLFVVSAVIAGVMAGKGRADICALGTGPSDGAIRNDKGQVVAVTRLKMVAA